MDGDVPLDDLLSKPIEQACKQAYGAYLFHKKRWRVLSGRRIKKKKGKGFGIGRKHYRPKYNLCDWIFDPAYWTADGQPQGQPDLPPELAFFKGKGKGHLNKQSMPPRMGKATGPLTTPPLAKAAGNLCRSLPKGPMSEATAK